MMGEFERTQENFIDFFRTDRPDTSPVSCYGSARVALFIGTVWWNWNGRIYEVDYSTRYGGRQTHVYVVFDECPVPLNVRECDLELTKDEIISRGEDVTEWVMRQPINTL